MFFWIWILTIAGERVWSAPQDFVVAIENHQEDKTSIFLGSGIALGLDWVVTNQHLIRGTQKKNLRVKDMAGRLYEVQDDGSDSKQPVWGRSDYTFLRIKNLSQPVISWASAPTSGVLSLWGAKESNARGTETSRFERYSGLLVHCHPTKPGHSGAGVFDEKERLIAIHVGAINVKKFCGDESLTPAYSILIESILETRAERAAQFAEPFQLLMKLKASTISN